MSQKSSLPQAAKSVSQALMADSEDNGPQSLLQHYNLLDDLNAFSRKYMHGEGRNPDAEHLSATELRGWVKKTLELTGNL